LPETKPKNLTRTPQSDDTEDEELPKFTTSQAKHISIPLQKINRDKQLTIRYGSISDHRSDDPEYVSSDPTKQQLKLQVDDNQVDNKN